MSRYIDITGQKFGYLTAIKPLKANKQRSMMWLCKCDCGNEKITSYICLKNGNTVSCGCMRNKDKIKKFCINGHEIAVVGRNKNGMCKACESIRNKIRSQTREYKEKRRKWSKKYNQTEKRKLYRRKWARKKRKTKEYKEYFIPYKKEYDRNHPYQVKTSQLKQKTNRNLRVVSFGQEGMKEFYCNIPPGMVGDHIIPLCGRKVSGLHVIWNLQYLPKKKNNKKSNKINLDWASEWYGKLLKKKD